MFLNHNLTSLQICNAWKQTWLQPASTTLMMTPDINVCLKGFTPDKIFKTYYIIKVVLHINFSIKQCLIAHD